MRPEAKEPRAVPSSPLPPQNQRPPPLPLHHQSADSPVGKREGVVVSAPSAEPTAAPLAAAPPERGLTCNEGRHQGR